MRIRVWDSGPATPTVIRSNVVNPTSPSPPDILMSLEGMMLLAFLICALLYCILMGFANWKGWIE